MLGSLHLRCNLLLVVSVPIDRGGPPRPSDRESVVNDPSGGINGDLG